MLARNIGASTAGAVLGAVLATLTIGYAGHTVPSLTGFHTALYIGCGAALAATIASLLIPRHLPTHEPSNPSTKHD